MLSYGSLYSLENIRMKTIYCLIGELIITLFFVVSCQNESEDFSYFQGISGKSLIRNGSFEGEPLNGRDIPKSYGNRFSLSSKKFYKNWNSCLFVHESFPEIHADTTSFYKVKKNAADGRNFLGLVTRRNKTYESVDQNLSTPLRKGKCYLVSLYLAQSKLISGSISDIRIFYTHPITLKVAGTNKNCREEQIFFQSEAIDHRNWLPIVFHFTPNKDFKQIRLIASPAQSEDYKDGNILIDYVSVESVTCDSAELKAQELITKMTTKIEDKDNSDRVKYQQRVKVKQEEFANSVNKHIEIALDSISASDKKIKAKYKAFLNPYNYNLDFCSQISELINNYPTINFVFKVLNENEMYNCLKRFQVFHEGRLSFITDSSFQIDSPHFETESFQLKVIERKLKEGDIAEKEQWQKEIDGRNRTQRIYYNAISEYLKKMNGEEANSSDLLNALRSKYFDKTTHVQWVFEFKKNDHARLMKKIQAINTSLNLSETQFIFSPNLEANFGNSDFENSEIKIKVIRDSRFLSN